MYNLFFQVLFCLTLFSCTAMANDNKESLWSYASPSADVILYFDTKQPEQAMDKTLWQLIQKDKNEALERESEGQLFDIKNRDMEALVNFYINSIAPFSATIEGVAKITGNIHNDIQKLLETFTQEGMPTPQINEIEHMSFYNFSVPNNEATPPIDIMFVPLNNNLLHFKINIKPNENMSQTMVVTSQENVKVLETRPQNQQAFVVAGHVEKIKKFPIWQRNHKINMMGYFNQIETFCICGNVSNLHLIISVNILFKNSESAKNFTLSFNNVKSKIAQTISVDEQPQLISKGNAVQITGKINIAKAWKIISHITSQPNQTESNNSPVNK